MMRLTVTVVAGALAGVLLMPGVAQARPVDQQECACQVFARHMDGTKKLRKEWRRFVNSKSRKRGLRGNHIMAIALKPRIKAYAEDVYADQQKACQTNEFMRKVCRAAKACVGAAAGTLYAGLQTGQNFWDAEWAALVACQIAIVTVVFAT
jgi:hypothetical protein